MWLNRSRAAQILGSLPVRLALGGLVTLAGLYLAMRNVHLDQVWQVLRSADPFFIGLGLISTVLGNQVKALRWQILFPAGKGRPRLSRLLAVLYIGQMLNIALPARAGDLSRAYLVGEGGEASKAFTLGTVGLEKIADLLVLSILLFALVPFIAFPDWIQRSETPYFLVTALLVAGALLLTWQKERILVLLEAAIGRLPRVGGDRVMPQIRLVLQALDGLRQPSLLLPLWGWSIAGWLVGILPNYFTFRALHMELPLTAAIFLLVVLQLGIAAPSSPGKLGVFQYICILVLALFGVTADAGFAYGWALYFVVFGPPLAIGGVLLWWESVRNRNTDGALEKPPLGGS